MHMGSILTLLLRDDAGQDIIEYALLCAGIGVVGVAVWPAITAAIGAAYGNWDTTTQGIYETPPPSGS